MEGRQAPMSNLFLFTGLAPAVAAVGCDAQEEVGGHGCDGDHETHERDEEVIVQGQGQVAGFEALLSEGEEWGALDFGGPPALSQLRICNTDPREGEVPGGDSGKGAPPALPGEVGFLLSFLHVPKAVLTFLRALNNPQGRFFISTLYT